MPVRKRKAAATVGDDDLVTDDVAANDEGASDDALDPARADELKDEEEVQEQLVDLYTEVEAGFDAQDERYNRNADFWDLYNSKLGPNQFYSGNSKIFVPITRNAVNARKTRFVNQLFPTSRRHIEATSSDGTSVSSLTALLEYYVRKAKLRTQILPALLRSGDVEGQYSIYISWTESKRNVTWKTESPLEHIDETTGDAIQDPDETIEDIEEEQISAAHPSVEVISDADVLVLPFTADSIPEALADGGSVTILRRWREGKIRRMKREGAIDEDAADRLLGLLKDAKEDNSRRDTAKQQVNAAGIHQDERGPYALVYETWAQIERKAWKDEPRLCMIYMAGGEGDDVLSCRRNPYWSDRCPLFSAPAEKVAGSFKGKSQLEAIELLQYQANDAVNEGMDSAAYALLPIIMTDPEKNPRVGTMILSLAAVWETSPESTQFAKFPEIWKDAFQIVAACKSEIFETLSVNPARITQQASTKKLTQAEIASEQQVDMLNTSDAVTTIEDEILTPMLAMFIELDHQFRDEELTVRSFGELGLRANMETIPPIQFDRRYQFTWMGVESSRSAQMIQQQISAVNVVRTIPPVQYQGYTLNLAPAISHLMENVFGPVMAPLIFKDMRSQLSMDPALEDTLMVDNQLDMPIHLLDDHDAHMASHIQKLQEVGPGGDPKGNLRVHIMKHQAAKAMAAQAQAAQMLPPGGGGGPGPGAGRGQPRPGGQSQAPRGGQNPAGSLHDDRTADPSRMPMPPAALPAQGVR